MLDPLSSAFPGFPALFAKIVHDVADQLTQRYITAVGLRLPKVLLRIINTEIHQFVTCLPGGRATHSPIVSVPRGSSLYRLATPPAYQSRSACATTRRIQPDSFPAPDVFWLDIASSKTNPNQSQKSFPKKIGSLDDACELARRSGSNVVGM